MTQEIQGRTISAISFGFDCQSGSWSVHYSLSDSVTKLDGYRYHTFDHYLFDEKTTVQDVFKRLIMMYEENLVIKEK